MCGRFSLSAPSDKLISLFSCASFPNLAPRYNIAPTQAVPVVRLSPENSEQREAVCMRWGLIPSWSSDPRTALPNARAEEVASRPSFRAAFRQRRCLVPADGFYEWKKGVKKSHPYAIRFVDDRLFAFAGLWETWHDEEGRPLDTVAILTTAANELIRPLHHRMPVILAPHEYSFWLKPDEDFSNLQPLLQPREIDGLHLFPVSLWVNDARHEGPRCLEREASLF